MLTLHFLNVGHGDCTIVEYVAEDGRKSFGLIDSNRKGDEYPVALSTLLARGAEDLAFVALTHPHADHYRGMKLVLEHFGDRIHGIFTFPIDRDKGTLSRFAAAYAEALDEAEDLASIELAKELAAILLHFFRLNNASQRWDAPTGRGSFLPVPSMPDVHISALVPHAGVRGPFQAALANGTTVMEASQQNHLSMGILVEYAGRRIVLGGDGTARNWSYVRQRERRGPDGEYGSLNAHVAKLPHHGSHLDCDPLVLDYIFGNRTAPHDDDRFAIISADGRSHPSASVLADLRSRGIDPYCTGLSHSCSGAVAIQSVSSNLIDPALVKFVAGVAEPSTRSAPCQGHIQLCIKPDGVIDIATQRGLACAMRRLPVI